MYVFMSHDVDWPQSGPGDEHVLARKERFDESIIDRVKSEHFNPYHGIPYVVDIEKDFSVKSTFFFRASYDDGQSIAAYEDEIKDLFKNGWEIGLHINNAASLESIKSEKSLLEQVVGSKTFGSRAHYLRISDSQMPYLRQCGFLYDSSLNFSKERFEVRNTGHLDRRDGLVVFPITFMDAYLFTYSKLAEENVSEFVISGLKSGMDSGVKFVTILWHDNSILMRGGRVYRSLLERILAIENVWVVRGIDAYQLALQDLRSKSEQGELIK
jgi:peptidoglycan/xylan/chitin deacetylase (PgdA/CDA1 family)